MVGRLGVFGLWPSGSLTEILNGQHRACQGLASGLEGRIHSFSIKNLRRRPAGLLIPIRGENVFPKSEAVVAPVPVPAEMARLPVRNSFASRMIWRMRFSR